MINRLGKVLKNLLGIILVIVFVVSLLTSSCNTNNKIESLQNRDYWPTEDWQISTPEAQGMDSAKLEQMMDAIKQGNHAIDTILIIRHGYIVWEEYPNDLLFDRDMPHILYSVTKSITSALVGIAIEKGYIKSVDQKVVDFFSDRSIANLDERKRNITIENLLTMTAGFEWDEISYGYYDSRNSLAQAKASGNYVQFVLDRPMLYEPSERFTYNTGNAQLLSAIITKSTGISTDEFASKYLFEPMRITSEYWGKDVQGIPLGGSELSLTPRDMAKFGYLYLNNGVWDGKQIVPADWVTKSTSNIKNGYGYLWWINPVFEYYSAAGFNGQRIFVAPKTDLICVITTSKDEDTFVNKAFTDYVLDSISTK